MPHPPHAGTVPDPATRPLKVEEVVEPAKLEQMHGWNNSKTPDSFPYRLRADYLVDIRYDDVVIGSRVAEAPSKCVALVIFASHIVRLQHAAERKVIDDNMGYAIEKRRETAAVLLKVERLRMTGMCPRRFCENKTINDRRVLMKPNLEKIEFVEKGEAIENIAHRAKMPFSFAAARNDYSPTNPLIAARNCSGCSSGGQWPQPGNST